MTGSPGGRRDRQCATAAQPTLGNSRGNRRHRRGASSPPARAVAPSVLLRGRAVPPAAGGAWGVGPAFGRANGGLAGRRKAGDVRLQALQRSGCRRSARSHSAPDSRCGRTGEWHWPAPEWAVARQRHRRLSVRSGQQPEQYQASSFSPRTHRCCIVRRLRVVRQSSRQSG